MNTTKLGTFEGSVNGVAVTYIAGQSFINQIKNLIFEGPDRGSVSYRINPEHVPREHVQKKAADSHEVWAYLPSKPRAGSSQSILEIKAIDINDPPIFKSDNPKIKIGTDNIYGVSIRYCSENNISTVVAFKIEYNPLSKPVNGTVAARIVRRHAPKARSGTKRETPDRDEEVEMPDSDSDEATKKSKLDEAAAAEHELFEARALHYALDILVPREDIKAKAIEEIKKSMKATIDAKTKDAVDKFKAELKDDKHIHPIRQQLIDELKVKVLKDEEPQLKELARKAALEEYKALEKTRHNQQLTAQLQKHVFNNAVDVKTGKISDAILHDIAAELDI